ncbi:MAG: extracellular solute-binding protein [Betaproteobacteria bacterium]|nr:extracellular solute-binding protein [Betaproteobacteria bacterium]
MRTLGSVLFAACCFAAGLAHAQSDALVLMTWGGVWQKTFEKVAADYQAKTGQAVKVVAQASADAGLARLIAQKDKPEVDLWTPNMVNYGRGLPAGVLAPLNAAAIPNAKDVPESLRFSHGITAWVSQRGIFYRKDLVPFVPTKWQDLWDPRLKGKMAGPAATFDPGYFPLMASVINGGNERNLDPGFAQLRALRENFLAFYTNNVQSIRMLEAGEVSLIAWGVLPNVISHLGPGSNYAFVIPKPAFVAETPITVIAGTPRMKQSLDFINYALSPEVQAVLASAFGSAPANSRAKAPEILQQILPELANVYKVDYDYLSSVMTAVIDRYDREIMRR